jgi:hypothetical protein
MMPIQTVTLFENTGFAGACSSVFSSASFFIGTPHKWLMFNR